MTRSSVVPSAAVAIGTLAFAASAHAQPTAGAAVAADSRNPRHDSASYWVSAGGGMAVSNRPNAWIAGHAAGWVAYGKLVAGIRYARVESFSFPSSRDRSFLLGGQFSRPTGRSRLVIAAGLGQMACANCTTTRFDTIATNPVAFRVVETRGVSSVGVSAHLEVATVGPYGGVGFAILAGGSRTFTYISPQLSILLGRMRR